MDIVSRDGGIQKLLVNLQQKEEKIRQTLLTMANSTRDTMISTIRSFKTRTGSNGRLEQAINVYTEVMSKDYMVIGVGQIAELNRIAPYWALVNWGGMVSPRARLVPGAFQPGDQEPDPALAGTRVGREYFEYMPEAGGRNDSRFLMQVRNPIAPMHYIEKTVGWLKAVWIAQLEK